MDAHTDHIPDDPLTPYSFTFCQTPTEKKLGNHFLKQHKQGKAGKLAHLFILKYQNKPIGCVRLEPLQPSIPENSKIAQNLPKSPVLPSQNGFWMRNLYIEPPFRQQGLGSALVQFMLNSIEDSKSAQPVFAFCQADLLAFYQKLGFYKLTAQTLPKMMAQKLETYQKNQPLLTAICWHEKQSIP